MMNPFSNEKPAGYLALIEKYALKVIPNWHESYIATKTIRHVDSTENRKRELFPNTHWPGDSLGAQLEFALKYDGTNLGILAELFETIPMAEMSTYIGSKPTGKYARRLWFLYEFLTEKKLPIADLKQGSYVDLLEAKSYYVTTPPERIRRQRVNDNLLGTRNFCPTVRRSGRLKIFESLDIKEECKRVVGSYAPEQLRRALSYLYTKETKSSFEIEHVKASASRAEKFAAVLHLAEQEDFCEKSQLIGLQHLIVDARFQNTDYRDVQSYIGETVSLTREKIHYVCPKPEDLRPLMDGFFAAHERMKNSSFSVVIHAAAIAYGFVFLHPFDDANGRIHRFLIHNILALRGFTPEGLMFPVSAAMLKNRNQYDASLESFSKDLNRLTDYSLDERGAMTVFNNTAKHYNYMDLTTQAEALFKFIDITINTELIEELQFLERYDTAKAGIQAIVDMPEMKTDLFIRFCLQNHGLLSKNKRVSQFNFLTDEETERMQHAFQTAYSIENGSTTKYELPAKKDYSTLQAGQVKSFSKRKGGYQSQNKADAGIDELLSILKRLKKDRSALSDPAVELRNCSTELVRFLHAGASKQQDDEQWILDPSRNAMDALQKVVEPKACVYSKPFAEGIANLRNSIQQPSMKISKEQKKLLATLCCEMDGYKNTLLEVRDSLAHIPSVTYTFDCKKEALASRLASLLKELNSALNEMGRLDNGAKK